MTAPEPQPPELFRRPAAKERRLLTDALRTETVSGVVLLVAALVALVWANTPLGGAYEAIRDFHFGIDALGLDLSVGHWASDGLLTVFFLVAGIELKRELTTGDLSKPAAAALPIVAALCGMVVPALFYTTVNVTAGGQLHGWAVPMATDIAFALGVLAVIGTHLPSGIRAFLLTLAIVDDLGAILVIAVFYTSDLNWAAFGGALAGLVLFRILHATLRVRGWYIYVPLALVIWGLMYNSGVHATISGVAMGMLLLTKPDTPQHDERDAGRPADAHPDDAHAEAAHAWLGERTSPAERIEHRLRPLSAGFAVPVFALFSAGVGVSGGALSAVFHQPESLGVMLGLFGGKIIGIFGGTWLTARFTRARLSPDLSWWDLLGVAVLGGIGFTVSLLVTELAFTDEATAEHVKAAVLIASLVAALAASVLLKIRNARYRTLWEAEMRDEDLDRIPDIDQPADPHRRPTEAARRAAEAIRHRAGANPAAGTGGSPGTTGAGPTGSGAADSGGGEAHHTGT